MKRNFVARQYKGIESFMKEVNHVEKNVNTVSFFLDDGIVRVTPKDGSEWDPYDFASHFHLLGYPKYNFEPGDPHRPTRELYLDNVYRISWWDTWDDETERFALVNKDLWDRVTD